MKKILISIITLVVACCVTACHKSFDKDDARTLLQKETLTGEEYDRLIELYSEGMDKMLEAAEQDPKDISPEKQDDIVVIFKIGTRLSKDEPNLTDEQRLQVAGINGRGINKLEKEKQKQ